MRLCWLMAVTAFSVAPGEAPSRLAAQDGGSRTVWAGVYSAAQAERGAKRYGDQCGMCHGGEMSGGGGVPGLAGVEFLFGWNNKTAAELLEYLKGNMPPVQPGSLTDAQYADIMAAMFKANGFPAGEADLPADRMALASVRIVRDKDTLR